MKVSIITVCFNRVKTIEKTIQSVLSQDYLNIEYIVIDGNSSDGTVNIIKKYQDNISIFLTEPDNGMYHALNKGLELATGNIIGVLHSDDEFYDQHTISKIVLLFKKPEKISAIYGNGIYIKNDSTEKIIRKRIGGKFSISKIENGWLPLHTTLFISSSLIKKHGNYNLDFKIASDTELILRYFYFHKIKIEYLNEYIVKMKMGGFSTSFSHMLSVLKEDYLIYKYYNISPLKVVIQKKIKTLIQYLNKI